MSSLAWWPDSNTEKLILEFMLKFSRLEYSLKCQSSFSKPQPYFQADWDAFKNAIAHQPMPDSLQSVLTYLKEKPPQKQTGPNKWKPGNDYCCDWDLLIKSLKAVRNNLFHGGKNPWAPARDEALIRHCAEIIDELVNISPDEIKQVYLGE